MTTLLDPTDPRPARPHRTRPAHQPRAVADDGRRPRRRAGLVGRRRGACRSRTPTCSTGSARSARRSPRWPSCACATRGGWRSTTRSTRTCRARRSATARSASCCRTPPGCAPRARAPWWERTPGEDWTGLAAQLRPGRPPARRRPAVPLLEPRLRRARRAARARPRARRGRRSCATRCCCRSAWRAPRPGRTDAPRRAGPSTRGPTCCCPSRRRTRAPWPPPGSCGRRSATSRRFAAFLLGDTGDVLAADTLEEMADARRRRPVVGRLVGVRPGPAGRPRSATARSSATAGSMPGFLASVFVDRERGPRHRRAVQRHQRAGRHADAVTCTSSSGRPSPHVGEPWRPLTDVDPALLELVGSWYWGTSSYGLRLRADGLLELLGLLGTGRGSRFRPAATARSSGSTATTSGGAHRRPGRRSGRRARRRHLRLQPDAVRPGRAAARRRGRRRLARRPGLT